MILFRRFSPAAVIAACFASLWASFRTRSALQMEILALRHQLGVLQRWVKRPRLTAVDRLFWAGLSDRWAGWRSALGIVKPEIVIGYRQAFRRFWTWKVRHGRPGRPSIARETRELIRKMRRENLLWGAPRIHGELLKLGIHIGETSVSKYLIRRRNPPSQTWRTFLENHVRSLPSRSPWTGDRGSVVRAGPGARGMGGREGRDSGRTTADSPRCSRDHARCASPWGCGVLRARAGTRGLCAPGHRPRGAEGLSYGAPGLETALAG